MLSASTAIPKDWRPGAADAADIAGCCNIFLGREPRQHGAEADWIGINIDAVIGRILEEEEFFNRVLPAVLLRQVLPHSELADAPSWPIVDWAQRRLPVEASTRRALGAARGWHRLLEILLADRSIVRPAPRLAAAGIDTTLRDRLEKEGVYRTMHSVVGSVEEISTRRVCGWAIDLCDRSEPVTLEFHVRSTCLGTMTCSEARPDIAESVGGSASVGFTFAIPDEHRTLVTVGEVLRIVHPLSQQQIGEGPIVPSSEEAATALRPPREGGEIVECYHLFFGRDPTPREAEANAVTSMPSTLCDLLADDEFTGVVLTPLLLRQELPHARTGIKMSWRTLDWAQRRLPVSASTRRAIGTVRSWALLLEIVLADADLAALAPRLQAAEIDRTLRERLEKEGVFSVEHSVVGNLDSATPFDVRGWALDLCDKSEPITIEFYADNVFLGATLCSELRRDIADAFGGKGEHGFTFYIPAAFRSHFAAGRILHAVHSPSRTAIGEGVSVHGDAAEGWDAIEEVRREIVGLRRVLERIEARIPELRHRASVPLPAYNDYWDRFYCPTRDAIARQTAASGSFEYRPLISVVLPTCDDSTALLDRAIRSVRAQSYDVWELIVADDASALGDELRIVQRRHAVTEPRIRLIEGAVREGRAGIANRAITAAQGDYVAFLEADGELAPDALYRIAVSLQSRRYGLLYSDEDRVEEGEFGRATHHTPVFKPAFDPELLLSENYIGRLAVVRRDLLTRIGGFRTGLGGAEDFDLMLRLSESLSNEDTRHVPRILYHRRQVSKPVPDAGIPDEVSSAILAAAEEHVRRGGLEVDIEPHADPIGAARRGALRLRWRLPASPPCLSIILPTRDRLDLLKPCVESVLATREHYPGQFEFIIIDNDSAEPETHEYLGALGDRSVVRVLPLAGVFNWSAIGNFGARSARGEVLLFLNNDVLVLTHDWCRELVANASRHEVGAVGARLLYADGRIQHAGVLVGMHGVAGHDSIGERGDSGGYLGRVHLQRQSAAVTGACLATRKVVFEEVGGFDELGLKVAFSDVDYCLKVRSAGYRIVYNPFAALYHFESRSRGPNLSEQEQARETAEAAALRARWGELVDADPFFNPHFERFSRGFERLRPPSE